jgi:hypothetical protein
MKDNNSDEMATFEKCVGFLNWIGIEIIFSKMDTNGFLPGFLIEKGMLIIDRDLLQHPGDILHEAGHIAVVPAAERPGLTEKTMIQRKNREAEEMMAIAWSYAACIHLRIDPDFVFHEAGYRGGSSFITDSCSDKSYFGLPMLQGIGLTADEKNAQRLNIPSYPHMIKWLCA